MEGIKLWKNITHDHQKFKWTKNLMIYKKYIKNYKSKKPSASDAEIRVSYYNKLENENDKKLFSENRKITDADYKKYTKAKHLDAEVK